MVVAFYPGSFDPPTLGHLDVLRRSITIFDRVIVGVGAHPTKVALLKPDERVALIVEQLTDIGAHQGCRVELFEGLMVAAAIKAGASVVVRGLRDAADLSYEMQLAGMNSVMAPSIQTVFLSSSPGLGHITSTLVRQIGTLGGPLSSFVTPSVARKIAEKLGTPK